MRVLVPLVPAVEDDVSAREVWAYTRDHLVCSTAMRDAEDKKLVGVLASERVHELREVLEARDALVEVGRQAGGGVVEAVAERLNVYRGDVVHGYLKAVLCEEHGHVSAH